MLLLSKITLDSEKGRRVRNLQAKNPANQAGGIAKCLLKYYVSSGKSASPFFCSPGHGERVREGVSSVGARLSLSG